MPSASACRASGLAINLSPADLPKEGSHFDLPIALAVLSALGVIPPDFLNRYVVLGELALDGALMAVAGALPAAIAANGREMGLICPKASGAEAAWAGEDIDILAPDNLIQLINHVKGTQVLSAPKPALAPELGVLPDLRDIKGQESGKRALEVAAAGGHHLLMVGPPGAGKSMLAQRLPSILPPMDPREMLDVSMVASLGGELKDGRLSRRRPFRSPASFGVACRPSLAAGFAPSPAKWRWPITACCFSMSSPNSSRAFWKSCGSRWRRARRLLRAPIITSLIRRNSSSWPR